MKPLHLILAASCLLVSCGEKETTTPATTASASAPSSELQAVFAASPKGEAKLIHIARTTAKPGDEVTLSGRVIGTESPFVGGRAAFTLGDPTILKACNENPDDKCETPWDSCCNTKEEKLVALATVQVVGADGRVLKQEIEGVNGLKKLGTVTVTGKVAEGSSPDSLVVNATAIQVQ
ncbi:hypothetical protein JIN84_22255 [Luteolibacter yonseiensis]|uniref:Lipoprotein n=1 Tax=Luteolibacter yonseiensis TaxID=1144680 RepID=A0A934R4P2_9BACT|nr:hypothetical protein [Luteolibacter yonseiensis]MBK1818358.1 hypothetical protein [Luteolibacter yonseiensis]